MRKRIPGTISVIWKRIFVLGWVTLFVMTLQASAQCQALKNIPDIVELVGFIAETKDVQVRQSSAARLDSMRRSLNKNQLYQTFEPLGLQDDLAAIMRFKIKLGVVTQFALEPNPDRLRSYLQSSDFLRNYRVALRLVVTLCRQNTDFEFVPAKLQMGGSGPIGGTFTSAQGVEETVETVVFSLISGGIVMVILAAAGSIWINIQRRKRKRRNKRYPCELDVSVTISPHTLQLTVVDISRSGANLECKGSLPQGSRVGLRFDAFSVGAEVIWTTDKYAGLKFTKLIGERDLATILESSRLPKSTTASAKQTKTAPAGVPLVS